MTDARRAGWMGSLAVLSALIGTDIARGPDTTAYWSPPKPAKTPDPKKRAKVKAARKQRNRHD